MTRILGLALAASIVAGCSGEAARFSPVVENSSTQFIRPNTATGGSFIWSSAPRSRAALMQIDDEAYERWGPTFQIKLVGDGVSSFSFGVDKITVRQDGRMLDVYGGREIADAIEAEKRADQAVMIGIAILGGISNALNAANPTPLTPSSIATTNMGIAAAAQATMSSAADGDAFSSAVAKTHLYDVTVLPGSEVAALVSIPDLDDDDPVEIVVQVGSDRHRFKLMPL